MAKYSVDVPVSTVASVDLKTVRKLYPSIIDNSPLQGVIDYPLGVKVKFDIPSSSGYDVTLGDALWYAAQAYKTVYRSPKKYGVWGHGMRDLAFESVRVTKSSTVKYDVGS